MALFNLGKKKEEPVKVTTPVDEVLRMREQGFTNNQIVQALQRNGYKTHQIFDAMNQADLKSAGPIDGVVPPNQAQQPEPVPVQDAVPDLPEQQSGAMAPEQQPEASAPEQPSMPQENYEEQIEEIAEAIIDEKWEDLMKNINKLLEWKEVMEDKMASLEQGLKDVKNNFSELQKGVIGKVAEYDKSMREVGINVKAMDTVFQKVLPTLTQNVNELSRLTKQAKAKK